MKYHVEFDIDFKRNTSKGVYIAIEGIDGSGKTTQISRLAEYFAAQGKKVITTREPRKNVGVIGDLIQQVLLGKTTITPTAFQYLFTAEREMHHEELILPSLKKGCVVISDRCFWSVIPYGIMDRGGKLDESTGEYLLIAQSLLSQYHQFTVPDYTFYLDLPLEEAMKRLKQADGVKEIYEDKAKLRKTIKGYQWLLQQFPDEFSVIDARQSIEKVTKSMIDILARKK